MGTPPQGCIHVVSQVLMHSPGARCACRGAGAGSRPGAQPVLPHVLQQVLEQDWLLQSHDSQLRASVFVLMEQLLCCFARECASHASRLTWVLLRLSEGTTAVSSQPPSAQHLLGLLAAACGLDSGDALVGSCSLALLQQVNVARARGAVPYVARMHGTPRTHSCRKCRCRALRRLGTSICCAG